MLGELRKRDSRAVALTRTRRHGGDHGVLLMATGAGTLVPAGIPPHVPRICTPMTPLRAPALQVWLELGE